MGKETVTIQTRCRSRVPSQDPDAGVFKGLFLMKLFRKVGRGPRNNRIRFGWRSRSQTGFSVPKSALDHGI